MTLPQKGYNNIGTQGKALEGNFIKDLFKKGGAFSVTVNKVPGVNATAGLHDAFQVALSNVGGWAGSVFNMPGMTIAGAWSIVGFLSDSSMAAVVNSYQWGPSAADYSNNESSNFSANVSCGANGGACGF